MLDMEFLPKGANFVRAKTREWSASIGARSSGSRRSIFLPAGLRAARITVPSRHARSVAVANALYNNAVHNNNVAAQIRWSKAHALEAKRSVIRCLMKRATRRRRSLTTSGGRSLTTARANSHVSDSL